MKLPCILFEKRDLFYALSLKFFCSFAESKSKIKLEIFFILSIREKDF